MEIGPHPVTLAEDLRRGERQAFARFFELYRLPVYNLVLTLTHGSAETPSIVRDVFITAYRQMLLTTGPIALAPWIYRVAVTACQDYLTDGGSDSLDEPRDVDDGDDGDAENAGAEAAARSQWQDGDLAGRFAQGLDALSDRHQAALLLTDVYRLTLDDLGSVFGVSRDAASSLLFRARENFRQAFADVSAEHAASACRLAEQAAAASVGRTLGSDEARKMREHAGYCRACRQVVKAWPSGLTGLALFLREAPLPQALEAAPVFATPVPVPLAVAKAPKRAAAAGVVIPLNGALRRTGTALASRAAAYAVAAVCLAAVVGMAAYVAGLDQVVPRQKSLLAASRQVPHGVLHAGKAAILPVGNAGGEAVGQSYALATTGATSAAPLALAVVAPGAGGTSPASGGAKRVGSAAGGGSSGGVTTGPQTGGTVGSGPGKAAGKGHDKTKPAGKGGGNGKATKPGKGGGNGKASKPAKSTASQKPQKPKASKPKASKPKATKPKQTQQTGKSSKPQK